MALEAEISKFSLFRAAFVAKRLDLALHCRLYFVRLGAGVKTLRTQDTSDLRHFGTGAEMSVRHFGTEVSLV